MLKLILIFVSSLFISCSPYVKDEVQNNQNLYKNNTLSDHELFENAKVFIANDQLDKALLDLDKIEVLFPSSEYANKSVLLTAYIHFLKKDYEKTRALSENYKIYYPGSVDIVYASYLEAMTYYVLIKKSDYSQKNAEIALEKFTFLLNAYPNNKYEIDIVTKIKIINDNLAESKLYTAKFYINKKNDNAALLYLLDIFKNHSTSKSIEESLYLISKIYYKIDELETSIKYASILAYNFPESRWYQKSYNHINKIDDISKNKNWFEKFNPKKLFKKNEENNSNDTIIQYKD